MGIGNKHSGIKKKSGKIYTNIPFEILQHNFFVVATLKLSQKSNADAFGWHYECCPNLTDQIGIKSYLFLVRNFVANDICIRIFLYAHIFQWSQYNCIHNTQFQIDRPR